jgi:hypothetical protein
MSNTPPLFVFLSLLVTKFKVDSHVIGKNGTYRGRSGSIIDIKGEGQKKRYCVNWGHGPISWQSGKAIVLRGKSSCSSPAKKRRRVDDEHSSTSEDASGSSDTSSSDEGSESSYEPEMEPTKRYDAKAR